MSDYIVRVEVDKLKPHPINSTIYDFDEEQHNDLKQSIEINGLLEPITIDNNNLVMSGHRRLHAIKDLGWVDVDCRLSSFHNPIISIIELNRYRKKTTKELLRESELLKEEYKKFNGQGKRNDLNGVGKNHTIVNVSNHLGVSTTKLKKLKSIQHYEPQLLDKIDVGLISVGKAYQYIQQTYINTEREDQPPKTFENELEVLLNKYEINDDQKSIIVQQFRGMNTTLHEREENDFYPTHPKLTELLCDKEKFDGTIWEPACGEGHMSKVLQDKGYDVISTDLYDRGFGESGIDFLNDKHCKKIGKVDNIITNPPFKFSQEFIEQSKKYARKKICIIGKTSLLEGVKRYEMWKDTEFPLKTLYQFTSRVSFQKNKISEMSGMISFSWYVFEKGYKDKPYIEWMNLRFK